MGIRDTNVCSSMLSSRMHDRRGILWISGISLRLRPGWWLAQGWIDLTAGVHEGVYVCLGDLGFSLRDL